MGSYLLIISCEHLFFRYFNIFSGQETLKPCHSTYDKWFTLTSHIKSIIISDEES